MENSEQTAANAQPNAAERSYHIVYLLKDGTRHTEQVTGHGHHEAIEKVRAKGASDILHVARADQVSPTIKVKKSPVMLLFKIAAALLATALAYFLVVSFS